MLSVIDQLEHLEALLIETGGVVTSSVARLDPEPPEAKGTLRVTLSYDSGHTLHVAVTLDVTPGYPNWINYALHLMDRFGAAAFRYDNAPHHSELESHPNHKHVGPEETPEEALPRLRDILEEIRRTTVP